MQHSNFYSTTSSSFPYKALQIARWELHSPSDVCQQNLHCMQCLLHPSGIPRDLSQPAPELVQLHVIFPERLSSSPLVKMLQEAVKGLNIKMFSWDCTETVRDYELVLRKYLFKTKIKTQQTFHIKQQSGMLVANWLLTFSIFVKWSIRKQIRLRTAYKL